MSPPDETDEMLDDTEYQIETLRQFREARIDEQGEDEFTDALLYIVELLEAVQDIELLVEEVADDRISRHAAETDEARQTAEEARETANKAVKEVKTLQNQFRVRKRDVNSKVNELASDVNSALDEMQRTADDLSTEVESLKEDVSERSTPESDGPGRQEFRQLSEDVESLEERVSTLLSTIPDPDRLDRMVERVTEAERTARAAKSTVTSLDAQVDEKLRSIRADVDSLESTVESGQSPSEQTDVSLEDVTFTDEGLARFESDLARLRDDGEVSDIAWRLLRTHLVGLVDDVETDASRQTPSMISAPKEGSNLHLGMVALAALRWLRSADAWATGGELHQHPEIPTGELSRGAVSGVLAPLVKTHGVAERRKTETQNATWEYRLTEEGVECLKELGAHQAVSEEEFARWAQSESSHS
jgi:uncharacterized coiled-coil DUF342 family protein